MLNRNLSHFLSVFTLTLTLTTSGSFGGTLSNPGVPRGVATCQATHEPVMDGADVAVVDGNIKVTNDKKNTDAYNPEANPILQILRGFDDIWFAGNKTWARNGSTTLTPVNGNTGLDGGASNVTALAVPFDFSNSKIINQDVWQENFDYVKTLTRPGQSAPDVNRDDKDAMGAAYLDDQKSGGFSVSSALGPLSTAYRSGAHAVSPYGEVTRRGVPLIDDHGKTVAVVDVTTKNYNKKLYKTVDGYTFTRTSYGDSKDSSDDGLGHVVTLLNTIADYGASTEAAKYHFLSPRPWRINKDTYKVPSFNDPSAKIASTITDLSRLEKVTCLKADGTTDTEKYYERPPNPLIIPMAGLLCAARTTYRAKGESYSEGYDFTASPPASQTFSSRGKDGAFPSGHTTEAFDRSLGYAYAIPQRFAEMVVRAAERGENRIVAGMHAPLDVIGGRIMGTAVAAATLSDANNARIASDAYQQAQRYFQTKAEAAGYKTITDYAHCTTNTKKPCTDLTDAYADHAEIKARYKAYMTYGLHKLDEPSAAPEVPKGAEVLLETRFPYLNAGQRRAVLATTEIDSNYPVIHQSRGWGRLNLVDAADGYGAFRSNVAVYMDANKGGFQAADHWRNDISGAGRLEKDGSGTLYLDGRNTYSGGTLVEQGSLIGSTRSAFGTGTLYQEGGQIKVSVADGASDSKDGVLNVSDFVQAGGALALDLTKNAHIHASRGIYLTGRDTTLTLNVPMLTTTTRYTVLSASHLDGNYTTVNATDANGTLYPVSIEYSDTGATVTVKPHS